MLIKYRLCFLLVSALTLSACGGGGGGNNDDTNNDDGTPDSSQDPGGGNVGPTPTEPETNLVSGPNNITNSNTATFEFSSNINNAQFEASIDDAPFIQVNNPLILEDIPDGDYKVVIRAINPDGDIPDSTPITANFKVDTQAPTTQLTNQPNALSTSNTASFEFQANENASFEVTLDGQSISNPQSPLTLTDLSDGSHILTIRATDDAGNEESAALEFTWEIDTQAPISQFVTTPLALTNSNTPTFEFGANENNVNFEVSLDGQNFSSATSPHSITNALADGQHSFQIRATDAAGNTESIPVVFNWEIDTQAPTSQFTNTPQSETSSTSAIFEFDADEDGATFEVNLDGQGFTSATSPFSVPEGLTDGEHAFQVRATDNAGNTETNPIEFIWEVDTQAPTSQFTNTPDSLTSSSDATFAFEANEDDVSFEVSLNGQDFSPASSPFSVPETLADGEHSLQVRATDSAGNTEINPIEFTWEVDTQAPTSQFTNTPSNLTSSSDALFEFEANEDNVSFEVSIDGQAFTSEISPLSLSALTDGNHQIRLRATDEAGNIEQSKQFEWAIDSTAPTGSLFFPTPISTTDADKITVTGYTDDDNGVTNVSINGVPVTSNDDFATWQVEIDLTFGDNELSVTASDTLGNETVIAEFNIEQVFEVTDTTLIGSGPEMRDSPSQIVLSNDEEKLYTWSRFSNDIFLSELDVSTGVRKNITLTAAEALLSSNRINGADIVDDTMYVVTNDSSYILMVNINTGEANKIDTDFPANHTLYAISKNPLINEAYIAAEITNTNRLGVFHFDLDTQESSSIFSPRLDAGDYNPPHIFPYFIIDASIDYNPTLNSTFVGIMTDSGNDNFYNDVFTVNIASGTASSILSSEDVAIEPTIDSSTNLLSFGNTNSLNHYNLLEETTTLISGNNGDSSKGNGPMASPLARGVATPDNKKLIYIKNDTGIFAVEPNSGDRVLISN